MRVRRLRSGCTKLWACIKESKMGSMIDGVMRYRSSDAISRNIEGL